MLYDILKFIKQEKGVSETVICQYFRIKAETLKPIIQRLLQKKLITFIEPVQTSKSCKSNCMQTCNIEHKLVYY